MATAEIVDRSSLETLQSTRAGRPLTDIEVAVRLGVSRFTVRSWRLKGTGPKFLKMGRAVRYRPEDIQEYEQRMLVNPAPQ